MGAKQTKIEGEPLPQTPQQPIMIQTAFENLGNCMDPRSPHICRTPLNEITEKADVEVYQGASSPAISTQQPMGLLRKRFFKGFSYNLNDPRSPSTFLNRTPLCFDDSVDRTLNLDDTFSDLFVESKVHPVDPPMQEDDEVFVEKNDEPATTPNSLSQEVLLERDPRSPSIGVERTPIIFMDDVVHEEEDEMIENILSTLSVAQNIPKNKPLERVKNKKRVPSKSPYRRDMIYEDAEAQTPEKTQKSVFASPSNGKRTPLSCVKNHPHLRSRSVEISGKSIKSRLPLTSFDDTLHKITPVKKILRYSNMENIENSFEF